MIHLVKEGAFWEIKMELDRLRMEVVRDIMFQLSQLKSCFHDGKYEFTNHYPSLRRGLHKLHDVEADWYEGRGQFSGFVSIRFLNGTEGQILNAVQWFSEQLQMEVS